MNKFKVVFYYQNNRYEIESESYEPNVGVPEQKYVDLVVMDVVHCLRYAIELRTRFFVEDVVLYRENKAFRSWPRLSICVNVIIG